MFVKPFFWIVFFSLTPGVVFPSAAFTPDSMTVVRQDIDRIYELAVRDENYDAALDGIVDYVEREDVEISDRRYALLKLGQIGAPELKDYLRDIAFEKIEIADGRELRGYAHLAYWQTLYAEATNVNDEERVLASALEATLRIRYGMQNERSRDVRAALVRGWAADLLCDMGKSEHMEKIAWSLNQYKTNERAQKRIELCRQQMELLNKFNSRLETMQHIVLNIDPTDQTELTRWALQEIHDMASPAADEILFAHIIRASEELGDPEEERNTHYFLTVVQAVSHLNQRNWTLDAYIQRGIDPNDRVLRHMLVNIGLPPPDCRSRLRR